MHEQFSDICGAVNILVAKATLELAGLGQSVSQLVCLVSKSQTFQFHHYDIVSA